jgi:hypothetical protein
MQHVERRLHALRRLEGDDSRRGLLIAKCNEWISLAFTSSSGSAGRTQFATAPSSRTALSFPKPRTNPSEWTPTNTKTKTHQINPSTSARWAACAHAAQRAAPAQSELTKLTNLNVEDCEFCEDDDLVLPEPNFPVKRDGFIGRQVHLDAFAEALE